METLLRQDTKKGGPDFLNFLRGMETELSAPQSQNVTILPKLP